MDERKRPRYRADRSGGRDGRHRMQMFNSQARTAESYVAGLGASGALIASAIVVFIVLIGIVTFNAWPQGGLFGGGGDSAIDTANLVSDQQQPGELSLQKLLGGPLPKGATPVSVRPVSTPIGGAGGGSGSGGTGGGGSLTPNSTGGGGGGSTGSGGSDGGTGTGGGGGDTTLQNTVSGAGSTVQGTTDTLGGAVDSTSGSNLGSNLLDPIGNTVNNTLQNLSGQLGG
jgi:hypothetical protein